VPAGVGGHRGIGLERHQPEEGGGHDPDAGHPGRRAEHRELLDVGDLADVDLLGELAPHRRLDVLVGAEPAAGQRPAPGIRRPAAPPQQYLQRAESHLQHRGEHFMRCRAGFAAATMGHVFDPKAKTGGIVSIEVRRG
jgi:hypothetical protein